MQYGIQPERLRALATRAKNEGHGFARAEIRATPDCLLSRITSGERLQGLDRKRAPALDVLGQYRAVTQISARAFCK
jgi:hypothetical protein